MARKVLLEKWREEEIIKEAEPNVKFKIQNLILILKFLLCRYNVTLQFGSQW